MIIKRMLNNSALYPQQMSPSSENAKNGKHFEIDVLSNLTQSPVSTTHTTKCTKAPKFAFSYNGTHYGIYGEQLITLDGTSSISPICKLAGTPKELPLLMQEGFVSVGGSKNTEMKTTWYSAMKHQAFQLTDSNGKEKFNKIIFADNLSDARLLTVDYKGTLRIYDWNNPTPILEVQCDLPNEVLNKTQGLNGGLLEDTTLLLYGTSFMAFFDTAPLETAIKNQTQLSTPYPISVRLTDHYGAVVDAKKYLEPSLSAQISSSPFPMTTMPDFGPFPARQTLAWDF